MSKDKGKKQDQSLQPSLFDDPVSMIAPVQVSQSRERREPFVSSHVQNVSYMRGWSQRRGYPRLPFTQITGRAGLIRAGEQSWAEFLSKADYSDVNYARLGAGAYDIEACQHYDPRTVNEQILITLCAWLYEQGMAFGFPEVTFLISDDRTGVIQAGESAWLEILHCTDVVWMMKATRHVREMCITSGIYGSVRCTR